MQVIATVLGWVIEKIVGLWQNIGALAVAVFRAAVDFGHDMICWAFDGFLGLAITALGAFDFSGWAGYAAAWGSLPAGMIEVLEAVGVSTAIGIIVSAIAIRITLQLIPFTRLGS